MADPIDILLLDDQPCVAWGLEQLLRREPDFRVLQIATDMQQAIDVINIRTPHVLIMELRLSQAEHPRLLLDALVRDRPWRTLIWSTENRRAFVSAALEAGVTAYLTKNDTADSVIKAIRLSARGYRRILSDHLKSHQEILAPSQRNIAALLGKGMSYEQVAEARQRSPHTIRKQCDIMQKKLGLARREELIVWAVSNGYPAVYSS